MVEAQKRGGLCCVSRKRHLQARTTYLPEYNPNQPFNYIIYEDASNLYAWALVQMLPYNELKFEENRSVKYILRAHDDPSKGYDLELCIVFPRQLHDKFMEYPPSHESISPDAKFSMSSKETSQNIMQS